MKAKAHVYKKDHINTDEIIPARYLNTDDEQELAQHCMEDIDTGFVSKVQPGDVIVAGDDFGCGSSREHAVWAIRGAKVAAVVAGSFARIFYRNAINCGFLVVEFPGAVEKISEGDELDINPIGIKFRCSRSIRPIAASCVEDIPGVHPSMFFSCPVRHSASLSHRGGATSRGALLIGAHAEQ